MICMGILVDFARHCGHYLILIEHPWQSQPTWVYRCRKELLVFIMVVVGGYDFEVLFEDFP